MDIDKTYNFNYCSGSAMAKKKRIQEQAAKYLAEQRLAREQEAEKLTEESQEALYKAARFSNTSAYMRNKERAKRLQESLNYTDRSTKNAMAHYIEQIVESAMLMDKEEFAKLDPDYKEENMKLIHSFLEQADINSDIRNKKTLSILEHIGHNLPDVKTGVLLESDMVTGMVTSVENTKVDKAISDLADNVQDQVAEIVSKEQEKKEEIQNDLDEIVGITESLILEASKKADEEAKKKLGRGEAPSIKKSKAEEDVEELLPEEEVVPEEEAVEGGEDGKVPADGTEEVEAVDIAGDGDIASEGRKETSIEISKDGKLKIRITNERQAFVDEIPKNGLVETLAVNEGMKMIEEGKEYNGDLALARAINYITVLETFNAMGLLNVDDAKKKEIVRLGGGVNLK